jgi:hypothetical protein
MLFAMQGTDQFLKPREKKGKIAKTEQKKKFKPSERKKKKTCH